MTRKRWAPHLRGHQASRVRIDDDFYQAPRYSNVEKGASEHFEDIHLNRTLESDPVGSPGLEDFENDFGQEESSNREMSVNREEELSEDRGEDPTIGEATPLYNFDEENVICAAGTSGIIESEEAYHHKIPLKWSTLAALLMNMGTKRLTEENYNVFVDFLKWLSPQERVPSTSTVKRTLRPLFRSLAFVATETPSFVVDLRKSGARTGVGRFLSDSRCPVTIVKPSEWASADVATEVFENMLRGTSSLYESEPSLHPVYGSVEDAPIVKDRLHYIDSFMIRNGNDGYSRICIGVVLKFSTKNSLSLRRSALLAGFELSDKEDVLYLAGKVVSFEVSKALDSDIVQSSSGQKSGIDGPSNKRRRKGPIRESPPFRAGDLIIRIVPASSSVDKHIETGTYVCLVFRCWVRERMRAEFRSSLVILEDGSTPRTWNASSTYIREMVKDTYALEESTFNESGKEIGNMCYEQRSYGNLKDGRRYMVYRFFLYCDGFTPQLGKKGSMGGCYMLPVGLRRNEGSAAGAIRRIALTPPGVSTNEVLSFIVEDIVKGTVEGISTTNAKGEEIVVFLDCIGFIADYPAVTETLDVLGHVSNVPCHLCFFARYDTSGKGGSRYGYSTEIHSGHPSFARNNARLQALREGHIPDKELRSLGMGGMEVFESRLNALHKLSFSLNEARGRVQLSDAGLPVVPAVFDSYRSSLIAPDHLFLGLGMDIMNCVLKHLPPIARRDAELLAKQALRENDLVYQNHLFNPERTHLNSMQISAMYSLLLISPYAFRTAWALNCKHIGTPESEKKKVELALNVLQEFRDLVCRTQYEPVLRLDGREGLEWYNSEDGKCRIKELQQLAFNYIKDLDTLWKSSEKAKETDKPNVHRLLEFYMFTLPAFGNVRFIQELVLENAHQDMKRGVTKSNFQNAQLQSMEHALANDWVGRLAMVIDDIREDGSNWTSLHCKAVLRLLGRPEWRMHSFNSDIIDQVRSMFPPPILTLLRSRGRAMSSLIASRVEWRISSSKKSVDTGDNSAGGTEVISCESEYSEDINGAKEYLRKMVSTEAHIRMNTCSEPRMGECLVTQHDEARWIVSHGRVGIVSNTLTTIRYGSIIQSLTSLSDEQADDDYILNVEPPPYASETRRAFWAVIAILRVRVKGGASNVEEDIEEPYALVLPCISKGGNMICISEQSSARVLIQLSCNVRRAMALHCCDAERSTDCCIPYDGRGLIGHSMSILDGGLYEVYGRWEGYPPRRG